jgi:hypothetical protein
MRGAGAAARGAGIGAGRGRRGGIGARRAMFGAGVSATGPCIQVVMQLEQRTLAPLPIWAAPTE